MKVRILIGFNGYEAGQVFEDWPAGMCDSLIAMGAIEEVKEDQKPEQDSPKSAVKKRG